MNNEHFEKNNIYVQYALGACCAFFSVFMKMALVVSTVQGKPRLPLREGKTITPNPRVVSFF